jgi:perosamine synthetase
VFDTGWLGLGSVVFEFENKIKEYLGAKNIVAVNSGTAAIHITLDAFGIGEGDEVIVPSLTFCASVEAITAVKAIPVFCDIDPDTLNVDEKDVEKKITSRTRAVMPVHYCGNPCNMDYLLMLGEKHNMLIIEDAAHAFGSSYKGKKIGSLGDATCFSFDPIKNITCGEGGAVALDNDEIADIIRKKRNLGIDKDAWQRYEGRRSWFYEVKTQGYRYHMSNINAAIGLAQLKKFNDFMSRKRSIVELYNKHFSDVKGLSLLEWNIGEVAPFSYIARVTNGKRDEMIDFLLTKGIGSSVHYIPNHIQPLFKEYTLALPATEKVWNEIITLPLYYDMTDGDVQKVIEAVKEFFA